MDIQGQCPAGQAGTEAQIHLVANKPKVSKYMRKANEEKEMTMVKEVEEVEEVDEMKEAEEVTEVEEVEERSKQELKENKIKYRK